MQTARAEADGLRYGPHEYNLDAGYTRRFADSFNQFNEYEASISRGVRIRGKARLDRKIGALGIEVAQNVAEDARHRTALLLKDTWMDLLQSAELTNIRQANAEIHRKSLAALEKRRGLNNASDLDVGLARSALEKSLSALSAAQGKEGLARETLLATFPEINLPVRLPVLPAPQQPENMQKWSQLVLARSHEITIFEKQAEQLSVAARRTALDRFADPNIGLRVFQERGGEEAGIGVIVSIPLGGGQRKAAAARDHSRAISAEYAAAFTRREVGLLATRDVQNVVSTYKTWRSAEAALGSSKFVIERIRRSYELGAHDYAQLLLAEQQYLDSKEAEARARHAAHNAWLQLKIDAHELWLENIH